MPLIPVTFLASAALALVLWRLFAQGLVGAAHRLFAGLVALYLVQSLLISVRWGYGIDTLRLPAGLVAAAIPALAWVGYRALQGRLGLREGLASLPVFLSWGILIVLPDLADLVIPASYLGFGLAILLPTLRNSEAPALTPLADASTTRRALLLIGAALIGSALTDGLLTWDFIANGGRIGGALIALVQSAFVLVMGLAARLGQANPAEDEAPPQDPDFDHAEVMARLKALFAEGFYRQEDLSLRRIARRLGQPDRRVSEAVNRIMGMNMSQFVNEYRVREACKMLQETDQSILQVALAVGFASKSNFNREFLRVTAKTPSAWRLSSQGN